MKELKENSQKKIYLYRVMDVCRVVDIFEKKSMYFSHPGKWDDPFETYVDHQDSHAMFAQCWSRTHTSDAIWRVYSPNNLGVRLSTTEGQLRRGLLKSISSKGFELRSGSVEYLKPFDLKQRVGILARGLKKGFDIEMAAKLLYLKRDSFSYENEWRFTVYCPNKVAGDIDDHIVVKIDPHSIINGILFDPRAPEHFVKAFSYYFKNHLGFEGYIRRSVLYKAPKKIFLPITQKVVG